jgi:hypothetical protein
MDKLKQSLNFKKNKEGGIAAVKGLDNLFQFKDIVE